jgi:hypothetical protein
MFMGFINDRPGYLSEGFLWNCTRNNSGKVNKNATVRVMAGTMWEIAAGLIGGARISKPWAGMKSNIAEGPFHCLAFRQFGIANWSDAQVHWGCYFGKRAKSWNRAGEIECAF